MLDIFTNLEGFRSAIILRNINNLEKWKIMTLYSRDSCWNCFYTKIVMSWGRPKGPFLFVALWVFCCCFFLYFLPAKAIALVFYKPMIIYDYAYDAITDLFNFLIRFLPLFLILTGLFSLRDLRFFFCDFFMNTSKSLV